MDIEEITFYLYDRVVNGSDAEKQAMYDVSTKWRKTNEKPPKKKKAAAKKKKSGPTHKVGIDVALEMEGE